MDNRIHRRVHTETLHYGRNGLYWWGQFTFVNGKFTPNYTEMTKVGSV